MPPIAFPHFLKRADNTRAAHATLFAWSVALALLSAIPAQSQVKDTISLPDSIWAGDSVTWVRKVPYYCEGPAYERQTGYVYFTQQIGNSTPNWPVWRVLPGQDTGIVWYNTYQNNGLEFDSLGQLIAAQNGRLSRLTSSNNWPTAKVAGSGGPPDTTTILVSGNNGVTFNQANDLSIHSDGSIFFTALGSAVYYRSPAGVLYTATNSGATISGANGIERLPWEPNAVYVNASSSNVVYRYNIGNNGSLSGRTSFITSIPSPDGGTYDSAGNRYVASYGNGEIRVYNSAGSYLGRIALRKQSGIYDSVTSSGRVGRAGNADNAIFGGIDMKTLYMTGDGGLFSIRLKIPGKTKEIDPTSILARPIRKNQDGVGTLREPRDALGRSVDEALPGAKLRLISVPKQAD
jgi:gluconolactonase